MVVVDKGQWRRGHECLIWAPLLRPCLLASVRVMWIAMLPLILLRKVFGG